MTDRPARPHAGPLRRAAPWFLAALVLTSVGLPAAAGALGRIPTAPLVGLARPLNATTVAINLTDAPGFTPAFVTVPAGTNATFHLVNTGSIVHTFTLLKQAGTVLPTNWTPAHVDAYLAANGTLANVSVAPGSQANDTLPFSLSTAFDSFEFISATPYQFQAGMHGFVNVTSTQPGLLTSENTSDQYQFLPNVLSATPAHSPFNLDVLVTNLGSLGHTFTVVAQTNVTLTTGNYVAYLQQNRPLVSVNVPSGAGSTVWANFTVPGPGVYQYLCLITGHFNNGMTGFLYVDVTPPQPPPPLSSAIVQGWVLVGSAVLLGIGLLLAAVTSYVGRFPKSSSPPGEGHH